MIPEHVELAHCTASIGQLQAQLAALRQRLTAAKRALARARVRHGYRRLQQALRRPTATYDHWPRGVMLVGPLVPGLVGIAVGLWISPWAAVIGFLAGAVLGLAALAHIMFDPQAASPASSAAQLHQANEATAALRLEQNDLKGQLEGQQQAAAALRESLRQQREQLLQKDWRDMEDPQWEAFLVRALELLGGEVEPTGNPPGQGVTLVAQLDGQKYAVRPKASAAAVGHDAVQQALAGMARYECDRAAVITNSGFSASAIALAKRHGCRLIADHEIPQFVRQGSG